MRPSAGRSPPAVSPYQAIRQEGMHADQLDRIEGKANAQKDDEAERPRSCAARARTKLAQNILHGRPRSATSFCSALAASFSAVAAALLSARSGRHSFHWALAAGGAPARTARRRLAEEEICGSRHYRVHVILVLRENPAEPVHRKLTYLLCAKRATLPTPPVQSLPRLRDSRTAPWAARAAPVAAAHTPRARRRCDLLDSPWLRPPRCKDRRDESSVQQSPAVYHPSILVQGIGAPRRSSARASLAPGWAGRAATPPTPPPSRHRRRAPRHPQASQRHAAAALGAAPPPARHAPPTLAFLVRCSSQCAAAALRRLLYRHGPSRRRTPTGRNIQRLAARRRCSASRLQRMRWRVERWRRRRRMMQWRRRRRRR